MPSGSANDVKTNRTIPNNLDDWLHGGPPQGVRSSLESHPFLKEMTAGGNEGGEQALEAVVLKSLSAATRSDNMMLSFAV